MSVALNHTIVWCRDKRASARYLSAILGLDEPKSWGPFLVVDLANQVSMDYHDVPDSDREIASQHYAFLVSESEFDDVFGRIRSSDRTSGPTPRCPGPARSTTTTGVEACTSRIPTATSSRS